jgi:hypothetical protein
MSILHHPQIDLLLLPPIVWEGRKAGFMAFHAFHTLSFPWPALGTSKSEISTWEELLDL